MTPRGRWIWAAIVAVLVVLVGGRWLAVSTVNRLWAEALGVGAIHSDIANLRLILMATAFVGASVWSLGNLYLVYRSIGSVHVPRRLANLEFVEAVPPRYLLLIVVLIGLILALLLSYRSGNWWEARALADYDLDLRAVDPVLGRDLSYYLFELPWQRTVHRFVTLGSGLMLAVTAVLYAAVGAIRWSDRQLHVMDMSRMHLAALLAVFGITLFWGYRLEPAEYVAGVHDVPLDAILLDVRLPGARLLGSLALVVSGASLLWIWSRRSAIVIVAWTALALTSFAVHYVVPAFSGAARPAADRVVPEFDEARREFTDLAYGIPPTELQLSSPGSQDPARLDRYGAELESVPQWDAFSVTVFLNRAATQDPAERFSPVELAAYPNSDGHLVPLYVAVRRIDLSTSEIATRDLTWERVHGEPFGFASGAVAVQAHRVSESGLPLFVPDIARPDSGVPLVSDLSLDHPAIMFLPEANDFVIAPGDRGYVGVAAGGLFRRLALAWVLQSPKLVFSDAASRRSVILWRRSVARRLERYAPFAKFGRPVPVVVSGSVRWMSSGYVTARAFPMAAGAMFGEQQVRGLRSSLVGVVDARTGATSVYLTEEPDPLSAAWRSLAPEIVRSSEELPAALKQHLRYPRELLDVQARLVARRLVPAGTLGAERSRRPLVGSGFGAEAFWWLGSAPGDTVSRLRRVATVERGEPPVIAAFLDGSVRDGALRLAVARPAADARIPGPSAASRRFAEARSVDTTVGVDGTIRMAILSDGVLALRSSYTAPADTAEPPRLIDVAVTWGTLAARGATLRQALRRLRVLAPPPVRVSEEWLGARQWFLRMDEARRAGDWVAFGRAYEELRRLLMAYGDTLP